MNRIKMGKLKREPSKKAMSLTNNLVKLIDLSKLLFLNIQLILNITDIISLLSMMQLI